MILVIDCSSSKRHKKERESRSCYFPLILYLAHGKSETRLPEVTTQVRNKPGWTNHRHLLRLLWEVQSKRDTPSRRSSQAKAPERDRHCLWKANANISLWFLVTWIIVLTGISKVAADGLWVPTRNGSGTPTHLGLPSSPSSSTLPLLFLIRTLEPIRAQSFKEWLSSRVF